MSFDTPMRQSSCNVSPSARRSTACITVQYSITALYFPSSVPSLDQYLQSLIPPRWCSIFCRGKRTGNLPDKVRAQVLVNGGHCEGCAGDDSACRNSSSSRRQQGRARYQSLARISRNSSWGSAFLGECLRQKTSNVKGPDVGGS